LSRRRPLVLVIDDDPDLRELLAISLAGEQLEVESAANGKEALDHIARRLPDLILLDMKMPVMDGWEFCRRLDGSGAKRPPIVVVTAAYNPSARAAEVQAEGWLSKPFEYEELRSVVKRLLPTGE
jgi:CheY-like chemotaxis protein